MDTEGKCHGLLTAEDFLIFVQNAKDWAKCILCAWKALTGIVEGGILGRRVYLCVSKSIFSVLKN